jgi:hypothetical protein
MNYRMLPVTEWSKLQPLLDQEGYKMLDPRLSDVAVAEEDGEVVAMLPLQLVMHCEPMIVLQKAKGNVNFLTLASVLDEALATAAPGSGYYLFVDRAALAKLANKNDMKELPWKVYCKIIGE